MPDHWASKDARELKTKISQAIDQKQGWHGREGATELPQPSSGFKRMDIVEASDESDESGTEVFATPRRPQTDDSSPRLLAQKAAEQAATVRSLAQRGEARAVSSTPDPDSPKSEDLPDGGLAARAPTPQRASGGLARVRSTTLSQPQGRALLGSSTTREVTTPKQEASSGSRLTSYEMFPDIEIEHSLAGIERAKSQGNSLFSQGDAQESYRWFSKCIWLVDSGMVKDAGENLRSILHSNRAFAGIKLQKWASVEDDCTKSLALNAGNTKALFRLAIARFELCKFDTALEAVDAVLAKLTDPQGNKEAMDLRQLIVAAIRPAPKAHDADAAPRKRSAPEGHKISDIDLPENSPLRRFSAPVVAPRVTTVGDDHIVIERSKDGIEKGKGKANELFAMGATEESVRWFSECIRLAHSEEIVDNRNPGWKSSILSVLYSNRAFAFLKLSKWREAEEDCSASLVLSPQSVKAVYRRSLARLELGKVREAQQDAEKAISLQPGSEDVAALLDRIRKQSAQSQDLGMTSLQGAAAPASPSSKALARSASAGIRLGLIPSIPSHSPKSAFEMLRVFNSMKRHPEILARYIKTRVQPQYLESLFSKAPIETDDLASMLEALQTGSTAEGSDKFAPALIADYVRHLMRTRSAETTFRMLSSAEQRLLCGLVDSCGDVQVARETRAILGM